MDTEPRSLDRRVYVKLSRLLYEQPGGVMLGDLCCSFRPPLSGAMAWAAIYRLEKARLIWLATLHGVVSLSTYAHDLAHRKRRPCPNPVALSIQKRVKAALQESRLRTLLRGEPPKAPPGVRARC